MPSTYQHKLMITELKTTKRELVLTSLPAELKRKGNLSLIIVLISTSVMLPRKTTSFYIKTQRHQRKTNQIFQVTLTVRRDILLLTHWVPFLVSGSVRYSGNKGYGGMLSEMLGFPYMMMNLFSDPLVISDSHNSRKVEDCIP